ncbi:isochorismate synthase [Natronomonas pharaonis DSM 2160]|uniref:isochorismate synthase n=1 Tax=Natronomonas pharaonis (strain ATCC 35678 / DSM 2160 / CIP 103997 / JCM 8858 / NBRC 14720 / NCIMB 2260 / Gabara) TaxID=348780 RepID=A0A1U7EWJ1_NATPD|nr:isochorismate synthase [Natronomonas pharaonis]CAI49453.1 isochorismate synthase [Natronomonas pharaonis DSM 2160]
MEPLRSTELCPDETQLVSRSRRLSAPPDPRTALSMADAPRTLWAAPDEATVVGSGAAETIRADGNDRFRAVREAANELFATGDVHAGTLSARPRLFGGFAFHDEHDPAGPWRGFPGARFVLPETQLTYAEDGTWLTVHGVGRDVEAVESALEAAADRFDGATTPRPPAGPPGIERRERTTSKDRWRESVTAAIDRIEAGELRKVVLAQALQTALSRPVSLPDVLTRLADTYPDCYRFLIEPDDGGAGFFGATPERLVGRRGRTVETGALAGTTGRGDTPLEDEWLAEELRSDAKNVHEHELVADAIRDQLQPYAASVRTGERGVRRLATVQHLETPITAELAADEHVLSLVEALHPTPAVGGLPPDKALATIRDTEPFERGWYAAPVGWFDAAGNGSFAVAIRSAVAHGEAATLFAGVGIVADSDPDREWDEVQLKYRPILDELE